MAEWLHQWEIPIDKTTVAVSGPAPITQTVCFAGVNGTNNAAGGSYGMHIDGLSFTAGSSGDTVGKNLSSAPGRCPRGNGDAQQDRSSRRDPSRPALQHLCGL